MSITHQAAAAVRVHEPPRQGSRRGIARVRRPPLRPDLVVYGAAVTLDITLESELVAHFRLQRGSRGEGEKTCQVGSALTVFSVAVR